MRRAQAMTVLSGYSWQCVSAVAECSACCSEGDSKPGQLASRFDSTHATLKRLIYALRSWSLHYWANAILVVCQCHFQCRL